MSHAPRKGSAPPESALTARAAQWLEAALPEVASTPADRAEEIHRLRTTAKQGRALARMFRPALGLTASRAMNRRLRDGARALARERDAAVARELLLRLLRKHRGALRGELAEALRSLPSGSSVALAPLTTTEAGPGEARPRLLAAARTFRRLGAAARFGEPELLDALRDSYRRCRRQMRQARASDQPEAFHEWRKRVKCLLYQLQFAGFARHQTGQVLIAQLNELQQRLGAEHDAHLLARQLANNPAGFGGAGVPRVVAALEKRKAELGARSLRLGRKALTRKPREFAGRARRWLRDLADDADGFEVSRGGAASPSSRSAPAMTELAAGVRLRRAVFGPRPAFASLPTARRRSRRRRRSCRQRVRRRTWDPS